MKKILLVLTVGCILAGCRSKLDLDNVDTTMEVNMGLALPVGNLRLTLNDLIGEVDGLYIDSLNNKGVLTWKFDTTTARYYHQLELADYLSKTTEDLNIYDQTYAKIKEKIPVWSGEPVTLPFDFPLTLDFPVDLPLDGINDDKTMKERLDSAYITSASFYSIINPKDMPFDWDWVDSIVLDLGPRFVCPGPEGNYKTIYAKEAGSSSYGFGDTIPLTVDAFTLDMMKKKLPAGSKPVEYYGNVYDTCSFSVHFKITIPQGSTVDIKPTSEFQYELGARFLNYTAIWGMFEPSSDMSGSDVIDMSDAWKTFSFMNKAKIPFAEPKLDVQIVTQIAGALRLRNAYVFTLDANNDTTFAWFNNKQDESSRWFNKAFNSNEYLRLNSQIGDSSTNMKVVFNKETEKGQIHRFFRSTPQQLGYKFAVIFDETETPQIRITPNTSIRVNSTLTMPFIFDQGVWIEYPDSNEVSLSQISIDSIQAGSSVIDTISATNVKLVLKALSTIPLSLKLSMRCLDENGNIVMDPTDPSKPFYLFDKDTISINPPSDFTRVGGTDTWIPAKPGESYLMASLTKEQLNIFPKISRIRYNAILDDKALDEAYKKGMNNVRLTEENEVKLKIGLAGNIDAVLNFNKENNK